MDVEQSRTMRLMKINLIHVINFKCYILFTSQFNLSYSAKTCSNKTTYEIIREKQKQKMKDRPKNKTPLFP